MPEPSERRAHMVDRQIVARGIRDRHVLDAMRKVPRETFVSPGYEEFAYDDGPLRLATTRPFRSPTSSR